MMINLALLSMYILVFGANLCTAQSNGPPEVTTPETLPYDPWPAYHPKIPADATNWGTPVQGVQLLIYTTNSVMERGSSIEVLTVIRNAATNLIRLGEQNPWNDFDFSLTNAAGNSYKLNRPHRNTLNLMVGLNPRTQRAMFIPVESWKSMVPGDYTLAATRSFWSSNGNFKMESNPLKVQIK
jgi:hypothetical protein